MFQRILKTVFCVSVLSVLSACGGGDSPSAAFPAPSTPSLAATMTATTAPALLAPLPLDLARGGAAQAAPTQQERLNDELRLIAYEQAYSLELNRRHQQQAAREKGATALLRDGVWRPDCELADDAQASLECARAQELQGK